MKNYALHQAEFNGFAPGAANLATYFRNWQARRAVRALEKLDDHLLRDMGVSRECIRTALRMPLDTNPALYLENLCHH
ncbi:MAG: DUF1127 domain-containing protein [Rhizobiales bacterium]|nr:DUF1127 domain-containing protein [Hyphomicrobiales bacterium]